MPGNIQTGLSSSSPDPQSLRELSASLRQSNLTSEQIQIDVANIAAADQAFMPPQSLQMQEIARRAMILGGAAQTVTSAEIQAEAITKPDLSAQTDKPLKAIFDFDDVKIGIPSDQVARLVDQGQATLADGAMSDVNRFAHKNPGWVPSSLMEMNIVLSRNGLEGRVDKAANAPIAAIEGIMKTANFYLSDSTDSVQRIDEILSQPGNGPLSQNDEVLDLLADMRATAWQFTNQKWLKLSGKPYGKLYDELHNELAGMDDRQLRFMLQTARSAAAKRAGAWREQIRVASNHPRVIMSRLDQIQRARL